MLMLYVTRRITSDPCTHNWDIKIMFFNFLGCIKCGTVPFDFDLKIQAQLKYNF